VDIARRPDALQEPGLLVLRLDAPLLYLNAARLRDQLRGEIRGASSPVEVAIVDIERSADMDIESMDILVGLSEQLREQGTELWLAEVVEPIREMLGRAGITGMDERLRVFVTLEDATTAWQGRQRERQEVT
jgi:MFS superfamily sulfate permease-like transporter